MTFNLVLSDIRVAQCITLDMTSNPVQMLGEPRNLVYYLDMTSNLVLSEVSYMLAQCITLDMTSNPVQMLGEPTNLVYYLDMTSNLVLSDVSY